MGDVDSEVVTGRLRQVAIFRRQREGRGVGNTYTEDVLQEGLFLKRLSQLEIRARINTMGERVRRSHPEWEEY